MAKRKKEHIPVSIPASIPAPKPKLVKPRLVTQARNLYGDIYSFPNYGNYTPILYTLSDANQGVDTLTRERLVAWSRVITAQSGFVESALRILAQFSVGNAYLPIYTGDNPKWGNDAISWLREIWYPSSSTRGTDFQSLMYQTSVLIDQDGDLLYVYGKDKDGFPRIQTIPSNRIRSTNITGGFANGPIPNTIESDGVIYDLNGKPVGYNVENYENLVDTMIKQTKNVFISTKNSRLIYDNGRMADKARGVPTVGSAILQGLSVLEIDRYLLEKIKLSSMLGYIIQNPSGEADSELQNTANMLNMTAENFGGFAPTPNNHAVEIVSGVTNRYIKAEGGDIRMLDSNTPTDQTKDWVRRLETQILSTIGVPHSLVFSQDMVSGRISDGVASLFNSAIERRQSILDRHGRFSIAWALAQAMAEGFIPENDEENLYNVIELTHPPKFSLNAGYDRRADLDDLEHGVKSMNDITQKNGKSSSEVMEEQEKETLDLITRAKRIADATGQDIKFVIQILRENIKQPSVKQTV